MVEVVEPSLWLIRHGETDWSAGGRHTGRTDVALNAAGVAQAGALRVELRDVTFARVLTSPLSRARETCRLAGLGDAAEVAPDLREWDYGEEEGATTPGIREQRPGWTLWRDGVTGGETVDDVAARADRVIAAVVDTPGDVALFAHGHVLRVLAARWLGLAPGAGQWLALDPGSVSVLGHEHEWRVIRRWNGGR